MSRMIRISIKRITIDGTDPFINFCQIMGVDTSFDKNRTAMKILEILYRYEGLNSTQISKMTDMSRGAILNHLENLIDMGLIFKYGKNYYLVDKDFSKIVDMMEKDLRNTIDRLKTYAKEIDRNFSD